MSFGSSSLFAGEDRIFPLKLAMALLARVQLTNPAPYFSKK
jgi:hypothetical protein